MNMKYILLLFLILIGCGKDRVCPQQSGPDLIHTGIGADFIALGHHLIFWGGLVLAAALVIRLVLAVGSAGKWLSWFPFYGTALGFASTLAKVPGLAMAVGFGISLGAASFLVGESFVWLGQHILLVVLSCVATAVAVAIYHHDDIRRWLVSRETAIAETKEAVKSRVG